MTGMRASFTLSIEPIDKATFQELPCCQNIACFILNRSRHRAYKLLTNSQTPFNKVYFRIETGIAVFISNTIKGTKINRMYKDFDNNHSSRDLHRLIREGEHEQQDLNQDFDRKNCTNVKCQIQPEVGYYRC